MKWERIKHLRTPVLVLAGGGAISAGAFLIYVPAGLVAVGLLCWLIEFLTGDAA